jgi:hypothetical protein
VEQLQSQRNSLTGILEICSDLMQKGMFSELRAPNNLLYSRMAIMGRQVLAFIMKFRENASHLSNAEKWNFTSK